MSDTLCEHNMSTAVWDILHLAGFCSSGSEFCLVSAQRNTQKPLAGCALLSWYSAPAAVQSSHPLCLLGFTGLHLEGITLQDPSSSTEVDVGWILRINYRPCYRSSRNRRRTPPPCYQICSRLPLCACDVQVMSGGRADNGSPPGG